jgi:hypothetical protein
MITSPAILLWPCRRPCSDGDRGDGEAFEDAAYFGVVVEGEDEAAFEVRSWAAMAVNWGRSNRVAP